MGVVAQEPPPFWKWNPNEVADPYRSIAKRVIWAAAPGVWRGRDIYGCAPSEVAGDASHLREPSPWGPAWYSDGSDGEYILYEHSHLIGQWDRRAAATRVSFVIAIRHDGFDNSWPAIFAASRDNHANSLAYMARIWSSGSGLDVNLGYDGSSGADYSEYGQLNDGLINTSGGTWQVICACLDDGAQRCEYFNDDTAGLYSVDTARRSNSGVFTAGTVNKCTFGAYRNDATTSPMQGGIFMVAVLEGLLSPAERVLLFRDPACFMRYEPRIIVPVLFPPVTGITVDNPIASRAGSVLSTQLLDIVSAAARSGVSLSTQNLQIVPPLIARPGVAPAPAVEISIIVANPVAARSGAVLPGAVNLDIVPSVAAGPGALTSETDLDIVPPVVTGPGVVPNPTVLLPDITVDNPIAARAGSTLSTQTLDIVPSEAARAGEVSSTGDIIVTPKPVSRAGSALATVDIGIVVANPIAARAGTTTSTFSLSQIPDPGSRSGSLAATFALDIIPSPVTGPGVAPAPAVEINTPVTPSPASRASSALSNYQINVQATASRGSALSVGPMDLTIFTLPASSGRAALAIITIISGAAPPTSLDTEMRQVAYDLAQDLGKDIDFTILGTKTYDPDTGETTEGSAVVHTFKVLPPDMVKRFLKEDDFERRGSGRIFVPDLNIPFTPEIGVATLMDGIPRDVVELKKHYSGEQIVLWELLLSGQGTFAASSKLAELDEEMLAVAKDLATELGKVLEFTIVTTHTYDPDTGENVESGVSTVSASVTPPQNYDEDMIDGEIIQKEDVRAYLPSKDLTFVPVRGMRVKMDGEFWNLIEVGYPYSGERVVMYELQLRR